jgi:phosphatidylserine synthase
MIIPTLFLIGASRWINLVVCVVFAVLTLSRVQFAHPVSVREHRKISLPLMVLWLGAMVTLAIAQHDIVVVRVVLIVAPMWTVVQVVHRLLTRADDARPLWRRFA